MKTPIIEKNNLKIYISEWEEREGKYNLPQSLIFPKNTYSPWLEKSFLEFYNDEIKPNTLVDIYRCYELYNLCNQYKKIEGNIIEVGVWRGGTGLILEKGLSNQDKLYLCDTFEGVVKASKKDNIYINGEHSDTSIELVNEKFKNNPNIKILKGIFPEDTASLIENEKFKICHIDVDVYDSAKDIFEWIVPRLIIGGMVIFDDYGWANCEGITNFVNTLSDRTDFITIYNINGHAIMTKIK